MTIETVSPKLRKISTIIHGVTSRYTEFYIVTDVTASRLSFKIKRLFNCWRNYMNFITNPQPIHSIFTKQTVILTKH
jgi:hypothetical protein